MKFKLLNGRLKDFNVTKTRIDWEEYMGKDLPIWCIYYHG